MRATLLPSFLVAILLAGCLSGRPGVDSSAVQVPAIPAPTLGDKVRMQEWEAALPIEGVFTIQDGSKASGDYPFTLKLGHDDRWLFALMVVHDVPMPNPFDEPQAKHGWAFDMFLDSKLGPLETPEDWKHFINVTPLVGHSSTYDGYWDGSEWVGQNEGGDPQNLPWKDDRPGSGTWGRGSYFEHDLLWAIYVPLHSPNTVHDGFQANPGEVFRLCLLFWVQGGDPENKPGPFRGGSLDTYPGDGYTRRNHYDPSTWMRLQLA